VSEELSLFYLIFEVGILVDDDSDEKNAVFLELYLPGIHEVVPVGLEGSNPLLAELGVDVLRVREEENTVLNGSSSLGEDHSSQRGERYVQKLLRENLSAEILTSSHYEYIGVVLKARLHGLESNVESVLRKVVQIHSHLQI
jgi:hypothetical protein